MSLVGHLLLLGAAAADVVPVAAVTDEWLGTSVDEVGPSPSPLVAASLDVPTSERHARHTGQTAFSAVVVHRHHHYISRES